MKGPPVLIVEDNPTTRKLYRAVLELEGYAVVEAPDGYTARQVMLAERPQLVLQDLVLPDVRGADLIAELRQLPGGHDVPFIVVSGFLDLERADLEATGVVSAFLLKPVEPSRLVAAMQAALPFARERAREVPTVGRVVLVDDDPTQRKLLRLNLHARGFVVEATATAGEALAAVRRSWPVAIVADVLMPEIDGFELTRIVRGDPELSSLPVVLTSMYYTEPDDLRLARELGAEALIPRADPDAIADVLRACMARHAPPPVAELRTAIDLSASHLRRVAHQLDRQLEANRAAQRRIAALNAQLVLHQTSWESLRRDTTIGSVLSDVLAAALDAAGISTGAIYARDPRGGLQLVACAGVAADRAAELFGLPALLEAAAARDEILTVSSDGVGAEDAQQLLVRAGTASVILAPDDPLVRSATGRILRAGGYDIVEAEDGARALALIEAADAPPFDLILTDVVMPNLNGPDLAARVRQRPNPPPIVFASGYADHPALHAEAQAGRLAFVHKPFDIDVLLGKIRELLDAREAR